MNKAYIVSTDKGEVKDFVGEVLRYVEEQKNWSRGQARQYIGWSDMVQGETTIVAQPGKIDSALFKDALKFAKTETKTDYKMARPDNYIGESRRERKHGGCMLKESEENGFDWKHGNFELADLVSFVEDKTGLDFKQSLPGEKDENAVINEIYTAILDDGGILQVSRYVDENNDMLECYLDGEYLFGIDPSGDEDADEEGEDTNAERDEFLGKVVDLAKKHGGRMLKESEENYYAVENVHVEVFGEADETFDTDPNGDSFSGYYKDDDELIKRVGEAFGIMNLQDFSKEHYDDEHRIIVSTFMADGIDEENPFDFSNATLDDVHGDDEVVITITYDGGAMNEDVDEDEDIYIVPEWALPYIVNNDPSGLEDDEIEAVDNFVKNLPGGVLDTLEDEDGSIYNFFSKTNDLPGKHGKLGNTCVEMRLVKI